MRATRKLGEALDLLAKQLDEVGINIGFGTLGREFQIFCCGMLWYNCVDAQEILWEALLRPST